jgi:hypothetical protein
MHCPRPDLRAALVLALALPVPVGVTAQGAATPCHGQLISGIIALPLPPLDRTRETWYEAPVRVMNSSHTTTRPNVLLSLLLLKVGDRCDEFQRLESERILRAQPFIADAHIAVVEESPTAVMLVVSTQDEFSFILATRLSGQRPYLTALTAGDGNLGGRGMSLAVSWTHTDTREGFGAAYTDYTFMNRPMQLQLAAGRGAVGVASYLGDISHPFYSDAQRDAWRGSIADLTLLEPFQRADTVPFDVGEQRQFAAYGMAWRIGRPGAVLLFGGGVSTEYDATGFPASGYDSTVPYDSLFVRYAPRRSVRLNAIAQFRALSYRRGTRLGTLNGTQDLRTGAELDAIVGRGFSGIDGSSADLFTMGSLFLGAGGRRTYAFLQTIFESRLGAESGEWTDAIASGRIRLYQRMGTNHTLVADGEFGGGWRTTRPFELDLGQPEGGVRGFGASHAAGGQRAAFKLEDRVFLGSRHGRVDVGVAAFVDAGKVWAGDVPFGTTTAMEVGAGIGLLGATPIGSRRTYRVDIAFPLTPDRYARWEVRVTVINISELGSFREPADISFGRELITTSTNFSYPR